MATAPHVPSGSVDFGRILRYPTDDPDWIKKVLIGGAFALLSSLLIGIPFVLGYFSRALRGAVEGAPRLPEWDDLGGIFNDGLRLTVVYLAYALGMALVITVPVLAIAIPLGMLGDRGAEAAGAIAGLGFVMVYGLVMLLSLALAVYLPAALTRAALRGTVGDGFAVREILGFIRANLGNYLLALVIFLLASFVAQFGMVLCCVGIFPASFWAYLILAAGLGETVRLNPQSL
jgi:hypothetical protein